MNCVVDNAWNLPRVLESDHHERLELLYVRVPFAARVESNEGAQAHRKLLDRLAQTLVGAMGLSGLEYGVRRWPADDLIAWRACGNEDVRCDEIQQLLVDAARPCLEDAEHADALRVAAVSLEFQGGDRGQTFARAVESARQAANDPSIYEQEHSASLLDLAIRNQAFTFRHQPIVDVASRDVFAYESLCRGTVSGMRFPDLIFKVAQHVGRVSDVGRVLRGLLGARLDAHNLPPTLQFINVHPAELDDKKFVAHVTQGSLARHATNIIFELTERAALSDYGRIKDVFAEVRRHGYRLAIDDLGNGAGLTALAELNPDFIKFDMNLVRNVHEHPIKQRLLARMQDFANEVGARTIAEGIEHAQERDAMIRAGCTLMQGYFFARPDREFRSVDDTKFGTDAWYLGVDGSSIAA